MPRFDLPRTTQSGADVAAESAMVVAAQPPLPPLIEPTLPRVDAPIDEPLVAVLHRQIRVLGNYWHAGWARALPGAWLRLGAYERLVQAVNALPKGFGFAIFDAWRPLPLQAELFDAAYADPALPPGYIAEPVADRAYPPPHLTGGTIDITLTFDGIPLALGTDFDDFTAAAATDSLESKPGVERELRRLLYHSLHNVGFVVLDCEWWHFEYGTPRWAGIVGAQPIYGPASLPAQLSR